MDFHDQGPFLNLVVCFPCLMEPAEVLNLLQRLEETANRQRNGWKGPRTLDADALLYGDVVRTEADLILPHPRLCQRRFALQPLVDLRPELCHPATGTLLKATLESLPDQGVVPWTKSR